MDDDASDRRAGAVACLGVAASFVLSALAAAMMPPELQGDPSVPPHRFWTVLSSDPSAHLAFHWCWALAGLCGLGAVPAIALAVRRGASGPVMWSSAGALLGFAVMARSHLMEAAFDRRIIGLYDQADPAFQQAVHVVAGLALDVPDGVLTYGIVGIWIAVVSRAGARSGVVSSTHAMLGVAAAIVSAAGVAGYAFAVRSWIVVAVGLGGALLMPAWFAMWARRLEQSGPAGAS